MSNVVASAIFCAKNTKKAENGDWGRTPVAIGQARNIVDSIMAFDNAVGRTTKTAVDGYNTIAKSEKLLEYAGKGVKYIAAHINPLICISSGAKVLTSDDKTSTLVQQTASLGAMFAGEAWMKKNLDKSLIKIWKTLSEMKCTKGLTEKALEFVKTHKCEGKIPTIIHGVAFVIGSCSAYAVGEKFGNLLTGAKTTSQTDSPEKTQTTDKTEV